MGSIKYVPPDVAQADGCADASEEERDPVAPGLSVFIFPHVVKFFKSQNPEILFCVAHALSLATVAKNAGWDAAMAADEHFCKVENKHFWKIKKNEKKTIILELSSDLRPVDVIQTLNTSSDAFRTK